DLRGLSRQPQRRMSADLTRTATFPHRVGRRPPRLSASSQFRVIAPRFQRYSKRKGATIRRIVLLAAGASLLAALVGLYCFRVNRAGTAAGSGQDDPNRVTQLPIGQVVLFCSGVGYFQREGQVEGSARVDLSFPVSDINDLIKSMVLRDLDGGHVAAV